MLNLIQHLTKSRPYETLKQVQGDRLGLFTRPSYDKKCDKLLTKEANGGGRVGAISVALGVRG